MLILHGEEDQVANPEGAKMLYRVTRVPKGEHGSVTFRALRKLWPTDWPTKRRTRYGSYFIGKLHMMIENTGCPIPIDHFMSHIYLSKTDRQGWWETFYGSDKGNSRNPYSWARIFCTAICILLGNFVVLLCKFKILVVIWPWKAVKLKNDDDNFYALISKNPKQSLNRKSDQNSDLWNFSQWGHQ